MLSRKYMKEIYELVQRIENSQMDMILLAAQRIADSIGRGGVLHVFGSGHSHMMAEDLFHRAGGLACVNAMLEESLMELNAGRATRLERLSGYAEVLLDGYDLRAGEVVIIVSNSGINSVPVEMALECKKRGLFVIALTNKNHTMNVPPRHESGKKLFEVADLVLDNCGVYGDAVLSYGDAGLRMGATSTIGGLVVMQTLIAAVADELLAKGLEPPVLISANTEGGDEHNRRLLDRYRQRIRYLGK